MLAPRTIHTTKESAKTDCSYCRSPCCQLLVELREDEADKFEWDWVEMGGRWVRKLRQREEDGYCVYYVHGKGCSTYEDKPYVCDYYSCREDERISPSLKYGPIRPIFE